MSYQQILSAQHRACDAEFAGIEQAAHRHDWQAAAQAASTFIDDTEAHFRFEEDKLFPRLQSAMPMAAGPTAVMCAEHAHLRELFAELRGAIDAQDANSLADVVDTLLMVMQQHNAKEENILYPMADRSLDAGLLDDPIGAQEKV